MISSICKQYGIKNYTINNDGTIDVNGDVRLWYHELTELPLTFNRVTGNFYCGHNILTTLKGSPKWVGLSFTCTNNRLTSLEFSPDYVGDDFDCSSNRLINLKFSPEKIGKNFMTYNNKLINNYCDSEIGGDFFTSFKQSGLEIKFARCLNYNEWRKLYKRKQTLNELFKK